MAKKRVNSKKKEKVKKFDVINVDTGEIVNTLSVGDRILRKESEDYLKNTLVINPHEDYVKVFMKPMLHLFLTLDHAESCFVLYLLYHLDYTSCVVKTTKGDSLTVSQMLDETELKERQLYSIIKRLCDHGVIAKVETEGVKYIAMNPFLFHRGKRVSEEMVDIFKNSKWAKIFKDAGQVYEIKKEDIHEIQ
jgi:cobalamin biosynthesis Co2+ chelatase CbiK